MSPEERNQDIKVLKTKLDGEQLRTGYVLPGGWEATSQPVLNVWSTVVLMFEQASFVHCQKLGHISENGGLSITGGSYVAVRWWGVRDVLVTEFLLCEGLNSILLGSLQIDHPMIPWIKVSPFTWDKHHRIWILAYMWSWPQWSILLLFGQMHFSVQYDDRGGVSCTPLSTCGFYKLP